MTTLPRTIEQRLREHAGDADACWIGPWTPEKNGYVRVWLHEREREPGRVGEFDLIHRVAHRLWIGPIPVGYQVDHGCRTRGCFNPKHLEAVTGAENNRRSDSPAAKNRLKTHCKRGHEFTPENTTLKPPAREGRAPMRACRACDIARQKSLVAPDFEDLARRYREQVDAAAIGGPRRAVPTICKQGHPFDIKNTYYYLGTLRRTDGTRSVQRGCRICRSGAGKKFEADPKKYAEKQRRKNVARRARYQSLVKGHQ